MKLKEYCKRHPNRVIKVLRNDTSNTGNIKPISTLFTGIAKEAPDTIKNEKIIALKHTDKDSIALLYVFIRPTKKKGAKHGSSSNNKPQGRRR